MDPASDNDKCQDSSVIVHHFWTYKKASCLEILVFELYLKVSCFFGEDTTLTCRFRSFQNLGTGCFSEVKLLSWFKKKLMSSDKLNSIIYR